MHTHQFDPFAIPDEILIQKILPFLEEDIGYGDISSGFIPEEENGKAKIIAKSNGIVSGAREAALIFKFFNLDVKIEIYDGECIKNGETLMMLSGNLRKILMGERTALNFLMKLSSIATSTNDYVSKIREIGLNTKIAATRKVTPGFGWFEKKAVFTGGGDTHRWNLSDMVLLKDTHRKYYNEDVSKMLDEVKQKVSFSKKIEIELENPLLIDDAIKHGADIIMLDNMLPEIIKKSLESITNRSKIIFEASGKITSDNFIEYAKSGIDIISTSQTILYPHIHVDFSLRLN